MHAYQIVTDCDCGSRAVLTSEDGPLVFDTEEEAEEFLAYHGIDNAQVEVI
jgi:hypothetical protein